MNTSSKRKILVATFIAILGFGALAQAQISDEQDVSKAKTKISQQQAEAAALKAYPQGKIEETELEREKGGLIYSVEFTDDAEVEVDADTGKVLKVEAPGHDQEADSEDDD